MYFTHDTPDVTTPLADLYHLPVKALKDLPDVVLLLELLERHLPRDLAVQVQLVQHVGTELESQVPEQSRVHRSQCHLSQVLLVSGQVLAHELTLVQIEVHFRPIKSNQRPATDIQTSLWKLF